MIAGVSVGSNISSSISKDNRDSHSQQQPDNNNNNNLDNSNHKIPQHSHGHSHSGVTAGAKKAKEIQIPARPIKPCHNAKLALVVLQNAIAMGARTQLNLTPPGHPRDDLSVDLMTAAKKRKEALALAKALAAAKAKESVNAGGNGAVDPPPSSVPLRRSNSFSRHPSLSSVGSRVGLAGMHHQHPILGVDEAPMYSMYNNTHTQQTTNGTNANGVSMPVPMVGMGMGIGMGMGVNNGNVFDKLMGDETLKEYYIAEEKYLTHHQHQLLQNKKKRKNQKSKGANNADKSKAHISINDQGDEFKEEFSSGDEDHLDVYNNTTDEGEEVVLDGGVDLDHHNHHPSSHPSSSNSAIHSSNKSLRWPDPEQ